MEIGVLAAFSVASIYAVLLSPPPKASVYYCIGESLRLFWRVCDLKSGFFSPCPFLIPSVIDHLPQALVSPVIVLF